MFKSTTEMRDAFHEIERQIDRHDQRLYEAAENPNVLTGDYFDYWYRYSIIVGKTDSHQAAIFAREKRYDMPR